MIELTEEQLEIGFRVPTIPEMARKIQQTDYKIIVNRYGVAERTEIVPTFGEGLSRVIELCSQPDVKGVPFLSRVTQTDLDIQARSTSPG